MRSYSLLTLFFLIFAVLSLVATPVEGGWFGRTDTATLEKKLADAQKEASIQAANAKASAKKQQADLKAKANEATKQAKKVKEQRQAEAAGFFAKKKEQLKQLFSRD